MKDMSDHIAGLLQQAHGIDISAYDDSFIDKSLQNRMSETRCASLQAYGTLLAQNHKEAQRFLASLHNSYSEFSRNPLTFAVLERIILPALVLKGKNKKSKELRVWSAACAAGQEAYSLAILLEELKNNADDKFAYRIFASDQDEGQVAQARQGRYGAGALNNLGLRRVKQWFSKHGETYAAKPRLKENIDFSVFDLFSANLSCPPASIFGDFDLVLCANLLFYYKNKYRKIIIEKAGGCLAQGGYLVCGEVEREILMNYNYHEVFPQSAIFCLPDTGRRK
jgi:chemotaxis protein methyltransferase CheR